MDYGALRAYIRILIIFTCVFVKFSLDTVYRFPLIIKEIYGFYPKTKGGDEGDG